MSFMSGRVAQQDFRQKFVSFKVRIYTQEVYSPPSHIHKEKMELTSTDLD